MVKRDLLKIINLFSDTFLILTLVQAMGGIYLVIENYTAFSSAVIFCLIASITLPLILSTLRFAFTQQKSIFGPSDHDTKGLKHRLCQLIGQFLTVLSSPFIYPMIIIQEKRALTKVKLFLSQQTLQEHENFNKLITQWNNWRLQVKQFIKEELGLGFFYKLN